MTNSVVGRKKLIEVSIPLEAINVASAREKSIRHGHPSTLHLWWARRPLAACRAVLFAQLVDDPSAWPERFDHDEEKIDVERRRLHKIIEQMVEWPSDSKPGDRQRFESAVEGARWEIARSVAWGSGEEPPAREDGAAILAYLQAKAPPVYDPFCGGGSIPLEAQRLGLRAYGSDLNPVAVLISKALVEIPPKFAGRPPVHSGHDRHKHYRGAQGLAEDVRFYGQWMRDEAERRIGHLYPKAQLPDGSEATVVAWLWARTVRSPDPRAKGAMVPLVSSFMLSTKEGKKTWVEPVIDETAPDGWRFEVRTGALAKSDEERLKKGTIGRSAGGTCILTGASMPFSYIRTEGQTRGFETRLMAIVAEGQRTRTYLSPHQTHVEVSAKAVPAWQPEGDLPNNPRNFNTPNYGLKTFASLFTSRQLVALTTFSDLIGEAREQVLADARAPDLPDDPTPLHEGGTGATAYADAIATYLSFAVSKASTRSSSLTIWEPGMGRLAAAMGRQALPMTWSYAETNPLAGAGGDIAGTAASVAENLDNLGFGGTAQIRPLAAQRNTFANQPIVISTDPPYYDNIGYADLSDFFYVWLRRSLLDLWPDLFRRLTTPKAEELVATPYRHGSKERAEAFFMEGMSRALTAMQEAATDAEPLVIYYAFKQSEMADDGVTSAGWASFLQAVVDARLGVDGTWPLRTEATNALKAKMNALASSVVLVCRQRPDTTQPVTRADFVRALKREMPGAVEKIRKASVGPVDMQQCVIGPGMGTFTRYARVVEDDDSTMTVKTALALINRVWGEIENDLDANFDPETQVALAWFATYGFDARAAGDLIGMSNAKNIPVEALFRSGVFQNLNGKASLTPREKLPAGWSPATDKTPTVWECVQHTARVLRAEDGGAAAAARLVAGIGTKAEDARKLTYRLYEIASQKGWAAEALVYNELAQDWTQLEDQATRQQIPAMRDLFGAMTP